MAQQLANAVGGVMSGAAPGMNQPILIPFNAGGHLGGQQGLVLSLPTANIQSLVAAAAAGGIMTLPLQNLQGKKEGQMDMATEPKLLCLTHRGLRDISGTRSSWWFIEHETLGTINNKYNYSLLYVRVLT